MVKYQGLSLDRKFHALADRTRRSILLMVLPAPKTVSEISAAFSISMPAISKHLRVLEEAGLIARKREGRTHFIRGVADALGEVSVLVRYYETFWKGTLNSLANYMEETMSDVVRVSKLIKAPVEKVFSAWTDPVSMAKWFTPMPDMSVRVEGAVTVGGKYKIVMVMPDGSEYDHFGEYQEITENKKVKFSWMSGEVSGSTVTVSFEPQEGSTLVTLVHEGLETEEQRKNHEGGWIHILECCDEALTSVAAK